MLIGAGTGNDSPIQYPKQKDVPATTTHVATTGKVAHFNAVIGIEYHGTAGTNVGEGVNRNGAMGSPGNRNGLDGNPGLDGTGRG